MTATPTPQDLDSQWLATKSRIKRLAVCTTETDKVMEEAIELIAEYRELKKQSLAGDEVDFGIVAVLILQLELLVKECG